MLTLSPLFSRLATAPALCAGVIERRHARRQNTVDYGTNENVAAAAFNKVKLRNGKTPDRRKAVGVLGESASRPEPQRTYTAEPGTMDGERKPLLERSSTSAM